MSAYHALVLVGGLLLLGPTGRLRPSTSGPRAEVSPCVHDTVAPVTIRALRADIAPNGDVELLVCLPHISSASHSWEIWLGGYSTPVVRGILRQSSDVRVAECRVRGEGRQSASVVVRRADGSVVTMASTEYVVRPGDVGRFAQSALGLAVAAAVGVAGFLGQQFLAFLVERSRERKRLAARVRRALDDGLAWRGGEAPVPSIPRWFYDVDDPSWSVHLAGAPYADVVKRYAEARQKCFAQLITEQAFRQEIVQLKDRLKRA